MRRRLIALTVGCLIATTASALAQRGPGSQKDPGTASRDKTTDEMRKLLAEIEKLQAEIKETEAQIRNSQGRDNEKQPTPPSGELKSNPKSKGGEGAQGGRFGSSSGGFGPGPGSGFGPGSGRFGPGGPMGRGPGNTSAAFPKGDTRAEVSFKRADRNNDGLLSFEEMSETLKNERDTYDTNKDGFIDLAEYKVYYATLMAKKDNPRFSNDVQALQSELDRLKETATTIAERIKEVESRLKVAKDEEATRKAASTSTSSSSGSNRGLGESRPSGNVEKRLDRIEQVLEEIQQELRRRK